MFEASLKAVACNTTGALRALCVMRLYPFALEATRGNGFSAGKLTPIISPV